MPQRSRATAVVIHDGKLLVIRRFKRGLEYYVLPGGGVEPGESHEDAAIRELWEETSVRGRIVRQLVSVEFAEGGVLSDYLCEYLEGEPALGSYNESLEHEPEVNEYEPMWISLNEIPDTLKAGPVGDLVRNYQANGFPPDVLVIRPD